MKSRIRTKCGDGLESNYSPIFQFNTTCPCTMPSEIDTTQVNLTSAIVFWKKADNADDYLMRYRAFGDMTWIEFNESKDSTLLDGLVKCTKYEYQLRSNCLGNSSNFTEVKTFNTACDVSVDDPELTLSEIELYPNPYVEDLTISFRLAQNEDILIQLFNINGQLIQTSELENLPSGNQLHNLKTIDHPSGIYLVRIATASGKSIVRRVIKQSVE